MEHLGAVSDEKGEGIFPSTEQKYRGFWKKEMLADYFGMLYRDEAENMHQRKCKYHRF